MGVPLPSTAYPLPDSEWPDTVEVVAPSYSEDDDGGLVQGDGATTTVIASVQRASTGMETRRSEPPDTVRGEADYDVLFPADPGVTCADWKLLWTARSGVAFAAPIVLASLGAAEPPGGLLNRWTVSAVRRS